MASRANADSRIRRQAAEKLVDADLIYACSLINSMIAVSSTEDAQAKAGLVIVSALPSLSMIAYESSRHLRGTNPARAQSLPPGSLNRAIKARHNFKLLDNNSWGTTESLNWSKEMLTAHKAAFTSDKTAVVLHEGKMLTSSGLLCFQTGSELDIMPSEGYAPSTGLHNLAFDYARYFAHLTAGLLCQEKTWASYLDTQHLEIVTPSTKMFYKNLYNGTGSREAVVLSAIHSALNYANLLLLDPQSSHQGSYARIRFLALMHAASSLNHLQSNGTKLPQNVCGALSQVEDQKFSSPDILLLRNTLVHYTLSSRIAGSNVDIDDPWVGLSQFYANQTFTSFATQVNELVSKLTEAMELWVHI